MSDPVPDDQLATFFERFRAEVSAQARPANAQVRRRARRHRSTRVAGAALTAGVVVAAPLSVYAAAGHGVAGPVGGTRAPASGPPASAAGAPVTATCVAATVPDAAFPSPPHGGGQQTTPQTGPLLYLQATAGRDGTVKLVSWTPGHSTVTTKLSLPAEAVFNANVSRDGRWVSWVAANGDLHLHSLTGGGDRVLRHHVDGRTLEPVWGPDSARLLIRDVPSGKVGTVAVPSGAYSPLAGDLSS